MIGSFFDYPEELKRVHELEDRIEQHALFREYFKCTGNVYGINLLVDSHEWSDEKQSLLDNVLYKEKLGLSRSLPTWKISKGGITGREISKYSLLQNDRYVDFQALRKKSERKERSYGGTFESKKDVMQFIDSVARDGKCKIKIEFLNV